MKLSELFPIVEFEIANLGVKYKLRSQITWLELDELQRIKDTKERGKFLLSKMIVEWNLTDEDDKPLPITPEVIERLPASIGVPIANKIEEIIGGRLKAHSVKKKNWLSRFFRS